MPSRLILAPAVEPVTLEEARHQLGNFQASNVLQDSIIQRRITEAREWVEGYLRRALILQGWDTYYDSWPSGEIIEPLHAPLIAVEAIEYLEPGGQALILDPASYKVDPISEPGRIVPAYGAAWPAVRTDLNAIRIRYTAGYGALPSDVPGPIREAILLIVGHWMHYQPAVESGVSMTRIPYAIEHMLANYRIRKIL